MKIALKAVALLFLTTAMFAQVPQSRKTQSKTTQHRKTQPRKVSLPTPVGVVVQMSDGTSQVYPLGVWLQFQNNQLRGVMPTQYVGQICVLQPDGTWLYPRPGRNVQIWRNGLLQRQGVDYTLNTTAGTVLPINLTWSSDDLVTAAYLY